MSRPLRVHVPGALYHVMSRGNAKQAIFIDDEDHEHFLDLVSMTTNRFRNGCRAYCLLWNHFHLLLQAGAHPISRMMQQLNSAYSQWFNRRHDRVGHVLQGRFEGRLVDREAYALQVLRYIARNPVEAGLVAEPAQWRWSSYRATAGLDPAPAWLAVEATWLMFDTDVDTARLLYVDFVNAGPGPEVVRSRTFPVHVDAAFERSREIREVAWAERHPVRPSLAELFAGIDDRAACDRVMLEAFQRYGYTLRELGDVIERHPTTVWRRIRQLDAKIKI